MHLCSVFIMVLLVFGSRAQEIGIILKTRGLVRVSGAGDTTQAPAAKGFVLYNGSRLQTGASGFATVKFCASASLVVLRPETKAAFNQEKTSSGHTDQLDLKQGDAYIEVEQLQNNNFTLFTPVTIASCEKGRCFAMVNPGDNTTTMYNTDGWLKLAYDNFSAWRDIVPHSGTSISGSGLIYTDSLPLESMQKINAFCEQTRNLLTGDPLICELKVKKSSNGETQPEGRIFVMQGQEITLKAFPAAGYSFTLWNIVQGTAVIDDITRPETRIRVMTNTVLETAFSQRPYVLTILQAEGGETSPAGTIMLPGKGSFVLRVRPYAGYSFSGWIARESIVRKQKAPLEFLILCKSYQDSIQPKFLKKKYSVTIQNKEYGTVSPARPVMCGFHDSIAISATPLGLYKFAGWEIVKGSGSLVNKYLSQTRFICDTSNAVLQPSYSNNAVEVSVLGSDSAEVFPRGNFFVQKNSFLNVTVRPKPGFSVLDWTVERGRAHVLGTDDAVIKCKTAFEIRPVLALKQFRLTLLPSGNGTVLPAKPVLVYHGMPVSIKAVPEKGKQFVQWIPQGAGVRISDPQRDSTAVVLENTDALIRAEFSAAVCSLVVIASKGGYTEPQGTVKVSLQKEIVVQAVPLASAAFIGWEIVTGADAIHVSDSLSEPEQTVVCNGKKAILKANFTTRTVRFSVSTNGLGRTKPSGTRLAGMKTWYHCKAVPNENQTFYQWAVLTENPVQIKYPASPETDIYIDTQDVNIRALFVPAAGTSGSDQTLSTQTILQSTQKVFIDIITDNQKGTVDKKEKVELYPGESVSLTAKPESGWVFDRWKILQGYALIATPFNPVTVLTAGKANAKISPVFLEKTTHTLSIECRDKDGKKRVLTSEIQ